jgi:hypothetical protein
MGDEEPEPGLPPKILEHGHGLSMPRDKPDAETGERFGHGNETLMLKVCVVRRPLWLSIDLRLVQKRCKNRSPLRPRHCRGKRWMIGYP